MLIAKEKTQTYLQRKAGCGCIICPNCMAHELSECDNIDSKWQIKGYRVDDWSKCSECNHWFDDYGEVTPISN